MIAYEDFLESKKLVVPAVGREVSADSLSPALFPFQRDLVRWSLRKGRAALFADTGLGKTAMQLEWARHAAARTLILAPLAVAQQTVREGEKFGIPVTYARRQEDAPAAGITITNYEMLSHFDPEAFGAVALDECFAAGTKVDTPDGWNYIENIREGDLILNASGVDRVSDVHRREVPYAIRIVVNGQPIISSPNHPYFTRRGWVCAQDLRPGDEVVATAASVRMVRGDLYGSVCSGSQDALLRAVLFSEMADEPAGAPGEGSHSRGGREAGREAPCLAGVGSSISEGRDRAYPNTQPNGSPRGSGEGLPPIERDRPQTFRAWGQWEWSDGAPAASAGGIGGGMGGGVWFVTGSANSRLSHLLQARLGKCRAENQHRSGWSLPLRPAKGEGCEAGREDRFARVDCLEVLKPGHPDLDHLRDADGRLYFYDLGGTRHPSYSVNGYLVHNSSILKAFEGKTRTALIEAFRRTPMRLCCTATPAPNDIAEIANHAEFLGVMSRVEMLAAFFVHDDAGWRLKGHAREPFYRWLASWGMSLKKPSDLGYDDTGYNLPPLSITPHFLETDYAPEGKLFADRLSGVTERASVRRQTFAARTAAAAALIEAEHREPWIAWCGLNDEANRLTELIPGSVNVEGSQTPEQKADGIERFLDGRARVLVTKSQVAGFGLNLQHCARMVFVGMGDSWEQYYQCVRRCWRFGQQREVKAHVVLTDPERVIWDNVQRKEQEAEAMARDLVRHVARFKRAEIEEQEEEDRYRAGREITLPAWLTGVGDRWGGAR